MGRLINQPADVSSCHDLTLIDGVSPSHGAPEKTWRNHDRKKKSKGAKSDCKDRVELSEHLPDRFRLSLDVANHWTD